MLKGAARISGKRRLCPCVSNLLQAIIHVESGFFFPPKHHENLHFGRVCRHFKATGVCKGKPV